jgi:hypothetical protein
MILSVTKLATALPFVVRLYVHSIEVSRIEVSAFGIIHPSNFIPCLWRLRTCLYPPVKVCPYRCHFSVKLGALLGCAVEDILVNAEDCLVNPRVDLIKLDNMYERLDVRPFALSCITGVFVCERPELSSSTGKL